MGFGWPVRHLILQNLGNFAEASQLQVLQDRLIQILLDFFFGFQFWFLAGLRAGRRHAVPLPLAVAVMRPLAGRHLGVLVDRAALAPLIRILRHRLLPLHFKFKL